MDKLFALFDRVAYMDTDGDSVTLVRGDAFPGAGKPATGQEDRLVKIGALGNEADLAATVRAGRPVKAEAVAATLAQVAAADAARAAESAAVLKAQGDTAGAAAADPALAVAAAEAETMRAAQMSAPGATPTPAAPGTPAAAPTPETPAPGMTPTSDPADFSVDAVNDYLTTADDAERERVLAAETAGKARKGIVGG